MSSSPIPVSIKPTRNIIGLNYAGNQPSTSGHTVGNTIVSTTSAQATTIVADAVVEENHEDQSVLTQHPIEQGSTISDHKYDLPAKLELIYAWALGSPQNKTQDYSFLKKLYQQLLGLKSGSVLCTVNTGKRVYKNMLIVTLSQRTDKDNENSMMIRVSLEQPIIVTTQVVPLTSSAVQSQPEKTGPTVPQGNVSVSPATNFSGGTGN